MMPRIGLQVAVSDWRYLHRCQEACGKLGCVDGPLPVSSRRAYHGTELPWLTIPPCLHEARQSFAYMHFSDLDQGLFGHEQVG